MSSDERLLYEARVRQRQAVIAGLAGALMIAASVIQGLGSRPKVDELTLDLLNAHKRFPLDVIAAVVNAGAMLALAGTLNWLYGAIRARRPDAPEFMRWLALAGAIASAITGVIYAILVAAKASDFASSPDQTYPVANHLTSGTVLQLVPVISLAGAMLLAIGFVLISLNALRVGLLTRFHGYLGVFAGALLLFQITQVPIVQAYWLLALAYLLSGRWPSGVPPTWRSGRAEPWPSTQELREQRIRASGGGAAARAGGGLAGGGLFGRGRSAPATAPAAPSPGTAGTPARTRATTPKRKRKKRR